jgi:hypothetical protein
MLYRLRRGKNGKFLGTGLVLALLLSMGLANPGGAGRLLQGEGRDPWRECDRCLGRGRIECLGCEGNGLNRVLSADWVVEERNVLVPVDCPRCKGTAGEPCLTCFGGSAPPRDKP